MGPVKPIPVLDRLARIVDRHVRGPDYAHGHKDLERLRVVLVRLRDRAVEVRELDDGIDELVRLLALPSDADLGDEAEDAEVLQFPAAPLGPVPIEDEGWLEDGITPLLDSDAPTPDGPDAIPEAAVRIAQRRHREFRERWWLSSAPPSTPPPPPDEEEP